MTREAELQEWSKLAYRALDDCYRVLSTVEVAEQTEQDLMDELMLRVKDLSIQALALNGMTSMNYNALRVVSESTTP